MGNLDNLVRDVTKRALERAGVLSDEWRQCLRDASITFREVSTAGFFAYFALPPGATPIERLRSVRRLDGVIVETPEMPDGADFILWLKDGLVDHLEGFPHAQDWPLVISSYRIK